MPRSAPIRLVSILFIIATAAARPASAQAPALAGAGDQFGRPTAPRQAGDEPDLFDDSVLHTIEITFEASDWQQRLERMDPARPEDLPAALSVDGRTLDRVGVRYKGNTSRRVMSPKKPFNITVDAFVDGQDLWGFDVINLNNGAADPSMLREAVGYRLLRGYMPVPRNAFARVTVQGTYLGVYLMVEQVNREMVNAWFPSNDGIVIKADPASAARLDTSALRWLGESIDQYKRYYEVKAASAETSGYEHLRELTRALAAPVSQGGLTDDRFPAGIRERLDVESVLWYLAGSNLAQNGDSYYAGHNYYLYETAAEPRFNLITWDMNMAFGVFPLSGMGRPQPGGAADLARQSPFFGENLSNRPLIQRLFAVPAIRADFVAHLRTLRDEAFDPAHVEAIGMANQDLIRDAVRAERQPIHTYDQFERNLREDVTVVGSGGGPGRTNNVVVGLLPLATARHAFMLDHAELQSPDVVLRQQTIAPTDPTTADAVRAHAAFAGSDAIGAVELRFRVDGGAEHILPAQSDGADGWSGVIPAQRAGREVSYVFRVGLADGRAVFFPAAMLTRPFRYRVAGVQLPRAEPGDLVLNELMADNETTLADEAGEFDDWVELYNRGADAIDLAGYFLSDDAADPWAFQLPAMQLAPQAYLLVWCDNDLDQGPLHASFALARGGESAVLATADAIVEQVDFGPQDADVSYARLPDGSETWVACYTATPGGANLCGDPPPPRTSIMIPFAYK